MKKQGVQRSTPRADLRETVIREGERLVSEEFEEVNLFARLVAIPVRWLYAGLYRVGLLGFRGIQITSLDMDEVLANSYNDTDARLAAVVS